MRVSSIGYYTYCTLLVNSHGYYNFQVEIDAATNQDVYIEITYKAKIYGFQPCTHSDCPSAVTI